MTESATETRKTSTATVETRKYKLAIIAPTCFYYQVDLFRMLAAHPRFDLMVYYCSDEALNAEDVPELYNSKLQWVPEEDLIGGFEHKFLRNYAPFGSYLKWPFGLMNFGIFREIQKERPDAVIIMGWTNLTWWLALAASVSLKIPLFYMNDANLDADLLQPKYKAWIKAFFLKRLLFTLASAFLSSGTSNSRYYLHYGVPAEKIVPFAYSMVHDSILKISEKMLSEKCTLREELGVPEDKFVILFCGRFIKEKGPFELLEAYHQVDSPDKALVFVGDGDARESMEEYVADHNLESVYFAGFQSRSKVLNFYRIADVLVLPSWRETWGMVVNEALCFGLPAIVSDQVGAGPDLVHHGQNGYVFRTGDTAQLTEQLTKIMLLPEEVRSQMGARSLQLIREWAKRDLAGSLLNQLDDINRKNGAR